MFKAYCASCHGSDAKGHGPAAPALKVPARDLTMLSKSNQGKFPAFSVVQTIRGDSHVTSHGSTDMPVWGVVLRSIGSSTPREVELRITNLTRYIESLQQK
jgi:mono/diheme cytochrome c family protein